MVLVFAGRCTRSSTQYIKELHTTGLHRGWCLACKCGAYLTNFAAFITAITAAIYSTFRSAIESAQYAANTSTQLSTN